MSDPTWRDSLPDELKVEPMFKDVADVASLAKIALDLKKYQGNSVKIPSQDAGPEARKEFLNKVKEKVPELIYLPDDPALRAEAEKVAWERMGRPADEKGYSLDGVELPEGVKIDSAALLATAKSLGLTKEQFKGFAKAHAADLAAGMGSESAARAALKTEWGQAFEDKVAQAKAAALKVGVPAAAVDSMPAAQLKVWANVAKSIGAEPRQVADQGPGASGKMTPAEALMAMSEIRNRPEYWDSSKNAALRARMNELAVMAYPD